eukprot:5583795-Alexandrium_andersonii.AAC.1
MCIRDSILGDVEVNSDDEELASFVADEDDPEVNEAFVAYRTAKQKMQSLRKDRGYQASSGAAGSDLRGKRLADRKARARCMAGGQTGHWQGDA